MATSASTSSSTPNAQVRLLERTRPRPAEAIAPLHDSSAGPIVIAEPLYTLGTVDCFSNRRLFSGCIHFLFVKSPQIDRHLFDSDRPLISDLVMVSDCDVGGGRSPRVDAAKLAKKRLGLTR